MLQKIRIAFMTAQTLPELESLKVEFSDELEDNPGLWTCVKNARRRINLIRKEVRKSFKIYELN